LSQRIKFKHDKITQILGACENQRAGSAKLPAERRKNKDLVRELYDKRRQLRPEDDIKSSRPPGKDKRRISNPGMKYPLFAPALNRAKARKDIHGGGPMTHTTVSPITPRGIAIDAGLGTAYDAVMVARNLLRTARVAALATLDPESGYPYATFTNLAMEPDGTPFFFTAGLALHARNILEDQRVSLTLSALKGDLLAHPRLTLVGRAEPIGRAEQEHANRRYLARFPKSKIYLGLGDAMPCRMIVEALNLSGGPARNAAQVSVDDLLTDLGGARELIAAEFDEIEKINARPDLVARLAQAAGAKQERWRVTGVDPQGMDLTSPGSAARLWFSERVDTPRALADTLARLFHPL
jgi:hypothetical protein